MNHQREFSSGALVFPLKRTQSVEWQKLSSFEFKRAYSVLNGVNVECCCVGMCLCESFYIYHIILLNGYMTGIIYTIGLAEDLELQ